MNIKPVVAIIGKPNSGKSTLFNRITGRQTAITSSVAGTTRDRLIQETVWSDHAFIVVDTGGLELFAPSGAEIWSKVKSQIDQAILDSDVILFLVDIAAGATTVDREIADMLRRIGKPIVLVASKADNEERLTYSSELYELGLGDPMPISAYHNQGIDELITSVIEHFNHIPQPPELVVDLRLAIIGRTNVGKSLLVNAITGGPRSIVSNIAGTTRDSIDAVVNVNRRDVQIVDTAGIRRRGDIKQGIEKFSVVRSIKAINRSQVTALTIDTSELSTNQDAHIASYVFNSKRGLVIIVNKWDLAGKFNLTKKLAVSNIRANFKFASHAPICFTSALNKSGINELLDTAFRVHSEWAKMIPRADINRTIMTAVSENPPPTNGRKILKIYSALQDESSPPSFTFYVNHTDMIHFSYRRYLENKIRQAHGFEGSPLRMRFRGRTRKWARR